MEINTIRGKIAIEKIYGLHNDVLLRLSTQKWRTMSLMRGGLTMLLVEAIVVVVRPRDCDSEAHAWEKEGESNI
ncbi:hypothetical protein L484_026084 [Morus notabilis]|uniref:Uncharacterized protein n=1 Tax=Morus notabilis TaxID=981085 RepID=W9RWR2_9ROSA|nr:hypothetical protein L484_026084 [Morus notabilis]